MKIDDYTVNELLGMIDHLDGVQLDPRTPEEDRKILRSACFKLIKEVNKRAIEIAKTLSE